MGTLGSKQGVQQGDPFGPLLFSLVLHKLIRSIASDSECSKLLFNLWYLNDGTLAGPKAAVNRAVAPALRRREVHQYAVNHVGR